MEEKVVKKHVDVEEDVVVEVVMAKEEEEEKIVIILTIMNGGVINPLEVVEEEEEEVETIMKKHMKGGMINLMLNVLIVINMVITLGSVEQMLKRRSILLMIKKIKKLKSQKEFLPPYV